MWRSSGSLRTKIQLRKRLRDCSANASVFPRVSSNFIFFEDVVLPNCCVRSCSAAFAVERVDFQSMLPDELMDPCILFIVDNMEQKVETARNCSAVGDKSEFQTHFSDENGDWNECLRPVGHLPCSNIQLRRWKKYEE